MQVPRRKRKAHGLSPPATTNTNPAASRFVTCPVCVTSVPAFRINEHLDACTSSDSPQASAQPDAHANQHPCQVPELQSDSAAGDQQEQDEGSCGTIVDTAGLPEPGMPETSQPRSKTCMQQQQPVATEVDCQNRSQHQQRQHQQQLQQPASSPQRSITSVLSAPVPLVVLRRSDGRKVAISDEQLQHEAPCELVRDVLPRALATELLKTMLRDAESWEQPVWHIFNQRHLAPRKSAYFEFADAKAARDLKGLIDDDSAADASVNVEQRHVPDCLLRASELIDGHVNRLAADSKRPLDALDRAGWRASYCFGNLYRDGQDTSGAHADRLTLLGVRPIIASLSLGASRLFRVRRAVAAAEKPAARPDPSSRKRKPEKKHPQPSVDITLPHNSLLIMWPPCQEAWKHEVPRMAISQPHPVAGAARVNLTFRRLKPDFESNVPQCRCGKRAILKAAYPKGDEARLGVKEVSVKQRYYFSCDNTQSMGCGFYARFEEGG